MTTRTPRCTRRRLRIAHLDFDVRITGINQYSYQIGLRYELTQQPKPLRRQRRTVKKLTPVILPPGRFRLSTKPAPTGSSPTLNTIRNRSARLLGGDRGGRADGRNDGNLLFDQVIHQAGKTFVNGPPPNETRYARCGSRRSQPRSGLCGTRLEPMPDSPGEHALTNPITGIGAIGACVASGDTATALPMSVMNFAPSHARYSWRICVSYTGRPRERPVFL